MLKIAIKAAKEAGKIILESINDKKIIDYKSAVNILTDTDLNAEKKILSIIKEKFPTHSFYTEESSNNKITQDDLWVIDPLDGTTNFFHTFPHFCISIAHLCKDKVDLGVIYDPVRKELFHAEINKGAFLNNKKIAVSNTEKLSDALLITGFAYERGEILKKNLRLNEKFFDAGVQGIRRTGSAALDLCYVACGRTDGYWEFAIKPWDHAAGSLIVTEAGGKITKINGEEYEVFTNDIVTSNSKIHEQMLKVLR